MFEFLGCTIEAPPEHMSAIVRVESSAHPYAIGVVGHKLSRQPQTLEEAIEAVKMLRDGAYNYSVGLAQVNQSNFARYGLSDDKLFDQCANLQAGAKILKACYASYQDWSKAYSCYYSGNAVTGFRHGYVGKVLVKKGLPILTSISSPSTSPGTPIVVLKRDGKSSAQGGASTNTQKAKKPSPATLRQRRLSSSLSVQKKQTSDQYEYTK